MCVRWSVSLGLRCDITWHKRNSMPHIISVYFCVCTFKNILSQKPHPKKNFHTSCYAYAIEQCKGMPEIKLSANDFVKHDGLGFFPSELAMQFYVQHTVVITLD